MSDKRKDYISWDEYFMGVAKLSALRSKDPNTQAVSYTHLDVYKRQILCRIILLLYGRT